MARQPIPPGAIKGAAGFLVGLAIWVGFSPAYNRLLASISQSVIRSFERPPVTRLKAQGIEVIVDREDFPKTSGRPGLPVNDLTFNFILLAALFSSDRRTFSNQNVTRFLGASGLLFLSHILAVIVAVQTVYALQLGVWSEVHYGRFERNLWATSNHFYRLVGMYAIAFALWWWLGGRHSLTPDEGTPQPESRKKGRRRGR